MLKIQQHTNMIFNISTIRRYITKLFFLFHTIFVCLKSMLSNKKLSLLKHIDFKNRNMAYYCRGMNRLTYTPIDQVISDHHLISSFQPQEASLIGYFFGLYFYKKINFEIYKTNFKQEKKESPFIIEMIDRAGNLVYLNTFNDSKYSTSPNNIFHVHSLIKNFSPIQAAYIGILAGMNASKIKSRKLLSN